MKMNSVFCLYHYGYLSVCKIAESLSVTEITVKYISEVIQPCILRKKNFCIAYSNTFHCRKSYRSMFYCSMPYRSTFFFEPCCVLCVVLCCVGTGQSYSSTFSLMVRM